MSLIEIVVSVITLFLAGFFIKKAKNNSVLADQEEVKDEINKAEVEKARNEEKLKNEALKREEIKAELEKELNREVSDEELVDFINKRYPSS